VRGLRAGLLLASALALGCGEDAPPPPALPDSLVVAGDGPSLGRLIDRLERWTGTPLAEALDAIDVDPISCPLVEARAGDAAGLPGALRCVESLDGAVADARGAHALVVSIPRGSGHVVLGIDVDAGGGATVQARLPREDLPPLLAGLRTGSGPPVLAEAETLLHARIKTTGIAETVAAGTGDASGQGERLFALSSSILAGTVLDGSVEAAWYAPREGDGIPPLAAALGVSSRAAAAEGTERYVEALRERWPISARRVEVSAGDVAEASGQCLDGLRVMPGFAPCWAASGRALVLAWNEATLRRALAGDGEPSERDAAVVRLDRFPAADDTLRRARGLAAGEDAAVDYPWSRLTVRVDPGDDLVLRAALEVE